MSRQMKDSGIEWVGQIPKDWEVQQLRMYYSRRVNKNKELKEQNLLSLSYGNVIRKNIETSEGLLPESFDGYNIIEANDIVIRGTDLQNDHRSLRTGLAKERGIITSAYITLKPKENINSDYYRYLLHSYDLAKVFYSMGGGMRQSLDYWDLIRMPILKPTGKEQADIVAYIDRKCSAIDTAIEKTKKSIEKLEEYKKAVITKAVTKGLDPDAKMKDSGVEWIGEVPETWGIGKLKYFYDITLGKMVNKDNSGDEGDSYLCAANIKWDGVNTDVHRRMIFTNKEKEQYLLNDGDVLIMEGGAAGTSCIYNNEFAPCYIQNSVNRCRGKKGHVNKFLYYWMHTAFYAGYINVACNQATIMHYTKEKVAETPFVRISEHEQLEIVNYLDKKCTEINNLITKKQEAINKWEEYKKSLIYYAVTGKIDCRNEVIE